jgi:hypothetical protein
MGPAYPAAGGDKRRRPGYRIGLPPVTGTTAPET